MPLIIEGSRVPTRWLERKPAGRVVPIDQSDTNSASIRVALINNMPDAALEDTELQFFDLLDAASENLPVVVKLFSLSGVPRADRGMRHLNSFYSELEELWNTPFDALIMTGTEPKCADLREEPYWATLTQVLDWAEENTESTILSCLAAHAGVLHSDGIDRHRLDDKRFGVFEFPKLLNHQLTAGGGERVRFPHSRWNEVRADALAAHGYQVLTGSAEAGVDLFVKQKKKSLFVHFQGHPEYGAETLFKEYRRDIRRFLHGERQDYPSMPNGCFDEESICLLRSFQRFVGSERREELIEGFPEAIVVRTLRRTWQSSATGIYANWLRCLLSKKENTSRSRTMGFPRGTAHHSSLEAIVRNRPAAG
jgi:homoserine O-succinyltransferase